jgi:hypothetical protein
MMDRIKRTLRKVVGYWRASCGYRPSCNLDAPHIDTCKVCEGYRGEHPPPVVLVQFWIRRWKETDYQ